MDDDPMARSPIAAAATANRHHVLRELLTNGVAPNEPDRYGDTPLHLASNALSVKGMKVLLEFGADPNARNRAGHTPLLMVLGSTLGSTREVDTLDCLTLLLASNADPNIGAPEYFPLHLACYGSHAHAVALIDAGADVRLRDHLGRTPLHQACTGDRDRKEIIRLLLAHGADPNAQDTSGRTPLHYAVASPLSTAVKELLGTPGVLLDLIDINGNTPFDIARQKRYSDFVILIREEMSRPT